MRKLQILLTLPFLMFAASCINEEQLPHQGSNIVEWTFHPNLDKEVPATKSIGDAGKVDQLRAVVYKETAEGLSLESTVTESWAKVQKNGVSVKLENDKTYKLLFWAEDKGNTAYSFGNDGTVSADYTDYLNGGFAKMEELDAFCYTTVISPETPYDNSQKVVLRRPLGQLNFVDVTQAKKGEDVVKVTFHSIPTVFDPFTGSVKSTDPIDESDDITFTFSDFTSEEIYSEGISYNYLSCNYILAPANGQTEVACTFELNKDGSDLDELEFNGKKAIVIEQRKKTNIDVNETSMAEAYSEWNGKFPIVSTLTQDPDNENCYIIDAAEDIAWLCDASHSSLIGENKTFRLLTNIDMGYKAGQMSMKLPAGSTFEGNGHTIKGLKLMIGLFGDVVKNLTVNNLIIDGAIISGTTKTNRGVLVNTLYGSSSFNNVVVQNSTVNTYEGAAGGMVGYISRKSKSDRSEALDVVFNNCHVINTDIKGSTKEGYFVGIFRGYDYGETLRFIDNCSCTPAPGSEPLKSIYVDSQKALWLENTDFSAYDAWLGTEECCRGMVILGENRFIAKWDGETKVKPLLAESAYEDSDDLTVVPGANRYVIYSAFDLAGVKTKATGSPDALYFMTDVDMNGAGEDGIFYVPSEFAYSATQSDDDNYFDSLNAVNYLDGQNHTIYNMNLGRSADNDVSTYTRDSFIKGTSYSIPHTIHKNLKMRNCQTAVTVKDLEDEEGGLQDASQGSIFISYTHVSDTVAYTMENIHVYESRVFALQGLGILASHFEGNMKNCTVNDCYIENWKCENNLEPYTHVAEIGGGNVTVSAGFYSYGEVGGLCGMIMGASDLSDCHVRRTKIHAYGQDDKNASITGVGVLGSLAAATAESMGYFLVPGRHVSTLIGDIRTMNGETIKITGCTVDKETVCTPRMFYHSNKARFIGQAYFIDFMDTEGKVIVDGHTLTLADGNRNTIRN
ncbi:MAG: hypothetical protein J6Q88_02035 [Bacteroidales bacterium]|nr:hypothetical protein [Bacteroidales bacterium]